MTRFSAPTGRVARVGERLVQGPRLDVTGALLCITVIGIPLGLANFKLIPISLFPLGKDIVSTDRVDAAFMASRTVARPNP